MFKAHISEDPDPGSAKAVYSHNILKAKIPSNHHRIQMKENPPQRTDCAEPSMLSHITDAFQCNIIIMFRHTVFPVQC